MFVHSYLLLGVPGEGGEYFCLKFLKLWIHRQTIQNLHQLCADGNFKEEDYVVII